MGGGLARAGYPYDHPGDWLFITDELPRLSGIAEGQARQRENRLADEPLLFRCGTTGCDADRDDHHHGAIRNRNLTTTLLKIMQSCTMPHDAGDGGPTIAINSGRSRSVPRPAR